MNFEETINSEIPSLVDFYADWCGPCKFISPIMDSLKTEYDGKLNVIKIDVDTNPDLAIKYNIRAVPTLLLFKSGEIQETLKGAVHKLQITSAVNKLM